MLLRKRFRSMVTSLLVGMPEQKIDIAVFDSDKASITIAYNDVSFTKAFMMDNDIVGQSQVIYLDKKYYSHHSREYKNGLGNPLKLEYEIIYFINNRDIKEEREGEV